MSTKAERRRKKRLSHWKRKRKCRRYAIRYMKRDIRSPGFENLLKKTEVTPARLVTEPLSFFDRNYKLLKTWGGTSIDNLDKLILRVKNGEFDE